MESSIKSLGTSVSGMQEFKSKIFDTEMAYESAEFAKNNILMKASFSILAQTNKLSDLALGLVKKYEYQLISYIWYVNLDYISNF